MSNKQINILYVFGSGRSDRIKDNEIQTEEFFYGYFHIKKEYKNTDFIEMKNEVKPERFSQSILLFFDKVFRKLTNLPFYMNLICTKENYKKIAKADKIIATNDRLGLSILPMVLFIKFKKKIELNIIVMGLFSKKKNLITSIFQKVFYGIIFKSVNKFIFLGLGELNEAKKEFKRYHHKFTFLPFCVDSNFWNNNNKTDESLDTVLFLGNDGNREFSKVVEIATKMSHINFKFVTSHNFKKEELPKNVSYVKANWNENILSDKDIKNFYIDAKITILPLIDSFQPSGQSVSLQSMAMGTPVLITKTKGFWDSDNFKNNENIFFVENNEIDSWVESIKLIYDNQELLDTVAQNGIKLIRDKYNLKFFNNNLERILFLNNK